MEFRHGHLEWAWHTRLLGYLISKGGYVDIEDSSGQGWPRNKSPLHWASTGEVVDILLAAGADREFPGPLGQTPLASVALRNRRLAVVRLLEHGADTHVRDTTFGNTVLMWACMGLAVVDLDDPPFNDLDQRLAIVELLVGQGAEMNAQSTDGETALHTAAKYDARCVQLLLELGADACVRDNSGKTPLDWATELQQEECAELLKLCADTTE